MTVTASRTLKLAALALIIAVGSAPLPATERADLGRTEKFRVMIDKVFTRGGTTLTEDQIRQMAEAGFNVISQGYGLRTIEDVNFLAETAGKYGIYYMPFIRGAYPARKDDSVNLVWASGVVNKVCSPNSDELWDWWTDLLTQYAQISVTHPALIGVFMDFELYDRPKPSNLYSLSYDDKIMAEFAQAQGIGLPDLGPAERCPWLNEQGLHESFQAFQIASWRERCRKLRQAIDAINPSFQIGVYSAGTTFFNEAAMPEWSTQSAPLILTNAASYGRPSNLLSHEESLLANRGKLILDGRWPAGWPVPSMHIGGIDPVVRGADPEFSGKNAVTIAEVTDGYWVFYEGFKPADPRHPSHYQWFTRANRAIVAGNYNFQYQPRETPDEYVHETAIEAQTDRLQVGLYGIRAAASDMLEATGKYECHTVKGLSIDYLRQFDVIALQNFNAGLPADSDLARALRRFVWGGGGLFLTHDTPWYLESPFPQIAVRDFPSHDNVEAGRHVADTEMVVVRAHEALGQLRPGTRFLPEFRDHMIFAPRPRGSVLIENAFGDPAYVAGTYGKGRVVFSGSYYPFRQSPEGPEGEAFRGIIDWLAQE